MRTLQWVSCALAALAGLAFAPVTAAQGIGGKQVHFVVPFAAGGLVEVAARSIGQALGQMYGQPVIVDNRVGANGNIGMEYCARAVPDGSTVCIATGVILSLNPYAYAKMPFDPDADFVPVVHVGTLNITLAVKPSLPVKSVSELVAYAKSKPGIVTWSSLGRGSTAHLYLEWIQARTGTQFNHIPYKGQPPMEQAVLSGEVDVTMLPPGAVLPLAQSGKLRVIAMMSGNKRLPAMPDVPPFIEQGYDLDFRNWIGAVLPRGASGDTVRRSNADFNKVLADKSTEQRLSSMGISPVGGSPEDFAAFLKSDRKTAAELVKIAKLHMD